MGYNYSFMPNFSGGLAKSLMKLCHWWMIISYNFICMLLLFRKVRSALDDQLDLLWHTTNIYMHPRIHEYAEKLVAKLPEPLKVNLTHFYQIGSAWSKDWHIWVETKWPSFSRRHFKSILLNENIWISITISLKFVSKGPIDNKSALHSSDNGLAPNRRQVIIWTNGDLNYWHTYIYASIGIGELWVNSLSSHQFCPCRYEIMYHTIS